MKALGIFLKEIRVKSYIKNAFVFVAMFFSNNLRNFDTYRNVVLAFVAFCFVSSAVYLFNDIKDIEKDRQHPVKKHRPLAAGQMSIPVAWVLSVLFLLASLAIAWWVNLSCLIIIGVYLAINLLYTYVLKKHSLFDVYAIGIGFVLRVMIGGYAIDVAISNYLLVTVLTLSLFLGFAKRYSEAKQIKQTENDTRTALKDYSVPFLNGSLWSMMTLTCLFYALWTLDPVIITRVGSNALVFTVPIVLIGFLEYLHALDKNAEGDPMHMVLTDKKLIGIVAVYVLALVYIIYI